MKPGKGAQIARSAGTSLQLVAREGDYATLRLRSGEMRKSLATAEQRLGKFRILSILFDHLAKRALNAGAE